MPLITERVPERWDDLEEIVTAILNECGIHAQRHVSLDLPRGGVDVDVLAEETIDGIVYRTICECKNWRTNIPRDVVHAFRTVVHDAGAHRGYIISRVGFQTGAIEATKSLNIDLVTFAEFQQIYFDKWINKRLWAIEGEVGDLLTYFEPWGPPGWAQLKDDNERAAYEVALNKYLFAFLLLAHFSPYTRMASARPFPTLPFDVTNIEKDGVVIPQDIKAAVAYREFFEMLVRYAKEGLTALRALNPITRNKPA